MKKFLIGLIFGVGLTSTTVVLAEDTIKAYLFPVTFEVNEKYIDPGTEFTVLNFKGHAYVPIRFVAERLGLGIRYIDRDRVISISNEPKNADELTRKFG